MSIASRLPKALDELMMCCEQMKEYGRCNGDDCPMNTFCLEETDFATIAYEVTKEKWEEFIKAADAEPEMTRDDWEAEQGNLLRCDPDWE